MNLKIAILALASLILLVPWMARAGTECTTYCHTRNMCSTSCQ